MKIPRIIPAMALSTCWLSGSLEAAESLSNKMQQAHWLGIAQIAERLNIQGYGVRRIQAGQRSYHVEAIAKDGRLHHMTVDPQNGTLLDDRIHPMTTNDGDDEDDED